MCIGVDVGVDAGVDVGVGKLFCRKKPSKVAKIPFFHPTGSHKFPAKNFFSRNDWLKFQPIPS